MRLCECLNIPDSSRCVTVSGSGGKSSLCLALARESKKNGKTSVITTTTHISAGLPDNCELLLPEEISKELHIGRIPVCAAPADTERLSFPGEEAIKRLLSKFDRVFIEADGSRMLPIKFPSETEPVFPYETDFRITVIGLSGINKPLEEVCHRFLLAKMRLPDLGETVDEETAARILWSGYGGITDTFYLNQADTPVLLKSAEKIKSLLLSFGAKNVAVGSLKNEECAIDLKNKETAE